MSTCRSHNFLLIVQNHKPSLVLERYSIVLHLMLERLRVVLHLILQAPNVELLKIFPENLTICDFELQVESYDFYK